RETSARVDHARLGRQRGRRASRAFAVRPPCEDRPRHAQARRECGPGAGAARRGRRQREPRAGRMPATRARWAWVPSLYYAEGLPYFVVMSMAGVMYKNLGIGNTEIAFYTSLLGLVWSVKPLWSPMAEMIGTLRGWVWVLQLGMAGALALLAL